MSGILPDEPRLVGYIVDNRRKTEAARVRAATSEGQAVLRPRPQRCRGIRLKIHWMSHHMTGDTLRRALESDGRVESVSRNIWHVEGFEGMETTTRIMRMSLSTGMSLEGFSHQFNHAGGTILGWRSCVYVVGAWVTCERASEYRSATVTTTSDIQGLSA